MALGAALAVVTHDDAGFLLAAAAGACGAALGSLRQLRDDVHHGAQTRVFLTFLAGQLLIGVTAGLLVFIADASAIVNVPGGSMGVAALSFTTGFSEAAFLGLIARVAASRPIK